MFTHLFDALERGALLLTVNHRLARYLSGLYDRHRAARGDRVWPTPEIIAYRAWLQRCWETMLDRAGAGDDTEPAPPLLLGDWQERALWERIISDSPQGSALLNPASAVAGAAEAWNLLREWGIPPARIDTLGNEDAGAFQGWAQRFENLCRQNGWLDGMGMVEYLLERPDHLLPPERPYVGNGDGTGGRTVILCGFDRQTPLQRKLFQTLAGAGVTLSEGEPGPLSGAVRRLAPLDRQSEWHLAARWARERLERFESGRETPVHGGRIGVVVPDLTAHRTEVARTFLRIFHPDSAPWRLTPEGTAFNLSLGASLAETPLVADALLLLGLAGGRPDATVCGRLLASPFWAGGVSEWAARGRLDAHLRGLGKRVFSIADLIHLATGAGRALPACPILKQTLETFYREMTGGAETAPPADTAGPSRWTGRFSRWLTRLGWPGEAALSSTEFQVVEAWKGLLTRFAALERVTAPLSLPEALSRLHRLAAESPFQPRSGEAPVQVLGVLEAVGERFDALWITGLSDDAWPPRPDPNPFLPIAFQRQHDFPRASRERELNHAIALLKRLLNASADILISHPRLEGDRPLHPSPLIADLPLVTPDSLGLMPSSSHAERIRAAADPEWLSADPGPSFPMGVPVTVATGALKAQSLCPFQAFARYRLAAEPLEEPAMSLDAARRGRIVHESLAHLWGEVGNSVALQGMTETEREELIARTVARTLTELAGEWPDLLPRRLKRLEQARLQRLLRSWLDLEAHRQAPFRVEERERSGELDLGGVTVRYRLDRVDRLEEGGLVILDYKTGRPHCKDWFGERPEEPQMPLYALARAGGEKNRTEPLAALAYAQLRGERQSFIGLSRAGEPLPGVAADGGGRRRSGPGADLADWPGVEAEWRRILTTLAVDYKQGLASVDPLPKACDHCQLTPLCRIHERGVDGHG